MIYNFIKKIIFNESFRFVFYKYLSFVIIFVNSFLLNYKLGIYFFGFYAFYKLLLAYSSYSNFGLNYALNVLPASDKKISSYKINKYFSDSLFCNFIFSLITVLIFLSLVDEFVIFKTYNVFKYKYLLILIYFFRQINILFVSYNRLHNNIKELNINYLLPPFFEFIILCFANQTEWDLFLLVLYIYFFSQILLFIINLISLFKLKYRFTGFEINNELLKKGIKQLFYNFSFYAIMLVFKTVFSNSSSIESFSEFSFVFSISEALFLATGAFTFLMLPKLLNMISNLTNYNVLVSYNKHYNFSNSIICILSVLIIPILNFLFPVYTMVEEYLILMLIAQFFLNSSFVYNTILINNGQEYVMICSGFFSILIIFLTGFFSYLLPVDVKLFVIIFSFVISSLFYSSIIKFYSCYKFSLLEFNFKFFIEEILLLKEVAILFVLLVLILNNIFTVYSYLILTVLHFLINYSSLKKLKNMVIIFLNNPNVLRLKIE